MNLSPGKMPVISKAMSPKRTLSDMGVVWGCYDFAPTWGIVQIHSYEFSWNTTSPMPISTNVHSAKESPSHNQILANAHKFFFLVSILILSVYGYISTSFHVLKVQIMCKTPWTFRPPNYKLPVQAYYQTMYV